jgi:hypothetical protein
MIKEPPKLDLPGSTPVEPDTDLSRFVPAHEALARRVEELHRDLRAANIQHVACFLFELKEQPEDKEMLGVQPMILAKCGPAEMTMMLHGFVRLSESVYLGAAETMAEQAVERAIFELRPAANARPA